MKWKLTVEADSDAAMHEFISRLAEEFKSRGHIGEGGTHTLKIHGTEVRCALESEEVEETEEDARWRAYHGF